MGKNIMGENIQIWVSGKTLACATSCSVEISSDNIDISCKDSGKWGATKTGKISWTISTDNLFVVSDYKMLMDTMLSDSIVEIVFSTVSNFPTTTTAATDAEGHYIDRSGQTSGLITEWEQSGDLYYGKCTIGSLSLSANNGEVASYSCTFNGVGALTSGKPA